MLPSLNTENSIGISITPISFDKTIEQLLYNNMIHDFLPASIS